MTRAAGEVKGRYTLKTIAASGNTAEASGDFYVGGINGIRIGSSTYARGASSVMNVSLAPDAALGPNIIGSPSSGSFNFTVTEPMGIVGVLAPEESPLLALVSLFAPAITSGNAVVALASTSQPYPAILLGEMLATSDLPGGVVNVLTGFRKEMVPTFATHGHLRALVGVANADERKALAIGAADSMKRLHLLKAEEPLDWLADSAQSLYAVRDTLEFKTTWHPIGA